MQCESGGNYSAVNSSSGAGGAYQILPSTWQAYGGQGLPQNAPKAEQDRIAGEIYARQGLERLDLLTDGTAPVSLPWGPQPCGPHDALSAERLLR